MSLVVLGGVAEGPVTPTAVAPALTQVSPWLGSRVFLTSWDGSRWEITDYRSGVFLTQESIVGLGMPPIERRVTASAAEAGTRFRSHRVLERPVVLALFVYSDASSAEWIKRDSALWRAFLPDKTCTLTYEVPGYKPRDLTLRFVGDDQGYDRDPVRFGWAKYAVEMVAESSFWEGQPIVREWQPRETQPFFGGTGGGGFGPPFYISSAQNLATAVMDNPGDVPAYAVWRIDGLELGVQSTTVGVGGRLITAPFAIPNNQSVTIDPRPGPRGKSAYDSSGARRTSELSVRDFAPIPAGANVPLSLAMTGTGRVTATLIPRYYRAWG